MWFKDSSGINNYLDTRSELYSMGWDNSRLCAFDDEFNQASSIEMKISLEQVYKKTKQLIINTQIRPFFVTERAAN
jgi:hypothetical protein